MNRFEGIKISVDFLSKLSILQIDENFPESFPKKFQKKIKKIISKKFQIIFQTFSSNFPKNSQTFKKITFSSNFPPPKKFTPDLCTWMNGRKYYIAVGETGSISAGNVTSQSVPLNNTWSPRIPQRCSIELITCPSCHFEVSVSYLNIPTCSNNGKCRYVL